MCQKTNINSSQFKQFNNELNEFYKYLQESHYNDEEIRKIFQPLTDQIFEQTANKKKPILITLTLIFITIYILTYSETLTWHLTAIGRIFMIKTLPYWDWTSLKNEKCLIKHTTSIPTKENYFNCELCEIIETVPTQPTVITNGEMNTNALKERYLDLHKPLVLTDEYPENWPLKSVEEFRNNLLLTDDVLSQSIPCYLSTNIYDTSSNQNRITFGEILEKSRNFPEFFFHLQNCEFQAMKQFRGLTPRPVFVPFELSPVQYNWLLWNRNYNTSSFKSINLIEKYTIIGQIVGRNTFKLLPRNNCELVCKIIETDLLPGQFLILTSLWNLEYRPGGEGENIAVILEAH